ncbi:MAG: MCE family protein [Planctomycetota bacterium]|nr:MAG: MCE family protein [Planctomycetota bacterium]
MPSTLSLEIKVGLLLISGLIALVAIVLVSERVDFESRYAVAAYLPAADGLLVGSPVTLSGIRVGKVVRIEPDITGRSAIRVDMEILSSFSIPSNATLTLATSGILGDSYLAFAAPVGPPGPALPTDGSASVDGKPGFFDEMSVQARAVMGAVNELLDEESRGDIRRLLRASADTMEQTAELMSGLNQRQERLDGLFTQVEALLTSGERSLTQLSEEGSKTLGEINRTLSEARAGIEQLRPLLAENLGGVQGLIARMEAQFNDPKQGLGAILGPASQAMTAVASIFADLADGRGVLGQLLRSSDLAQDLNAIAINLATAAETIADRPSVLVWGQGRRDTEASRERRTQIRQRRAFMEGYGSAGMGED